MAVPVPLLRPPTGVRTLTFSGGVQVDTPNGVTATVARQSRTQGDGLSVPGGYGVWPAATNLCKYSNQVAGPGTGWTNLGGGSVVTFVTRSDLFTPMYFSRAVVSASNEGIQTTGTTIFAAIAATTQYTLSVYMDIPVGETVTLQWNDYDAGAAFLGAHSVACAGTGTLTRYTLTATTNATTTQMNAYAYSASGAQTFEAGAWQMELGAIATPYIATDGGTAARTAGRVTLPVAELFTGAQGWVCISAIPRWASTQRTGTDDAYFWLSQIDANNYIILDYDVSSQQWQFGRSATSGFDGGAQPAGTFAQDETIVMSFAWTSTTVATAINGVVTSAAASNPILSSFANVSANIGSDGATKHTDANTRFVLIGKGTLTTADSVLLNSWGNTVPTLNQIAMLSPGSQPTCLMPCGTADAILLPAYFGGA